MSLQAPLVPSPIELRAENKGNLTVLKCRTPGEAFLVAKELEAADILVVLPSAEELEQEYHTKGSVSIQVSTRSYEASTELKRAIETNPGADRENQPLSSGMLFVAFALGLMPLLSLLFVFPLRDTYKKRGYTRKWKAFRNAFVIGSVTFMVGCNVIAVKTSPGHSRPDSIPPTKR